MELFILFLRCFKKSYFIVSCFT